MHGRIGEAEAYATLALESADRQLAGGAPRRPAGISGVSRHQSRQPETGRADRQGGAGKFRRGPSFFRVCAVSLLGHAQRQSGDQSTASATLRETVDLGRRHGNEAITLDALGGLTTLMCAQGQLREAMHLCDEAVHSYVDGRGRPLPVAGLVYVPRGVLNYESNDLEQARHDLSTGITLCRRVGMIYFTLLGQRTLARVYHASGDYQAAWNTLAAASQLAVQSENPRRKRLVDAVAAELNLREGNIAAAERALEGLRTGRETPSEYERLVAVRLQIGQGDLFWAESILSQVERSAQARRFGSLIVIHVLQALCRRGQDDWQGALDRLRRAVCLAAPEDYRRGLHR